MKPFSRFFTKAPLPPPPPSLDQRIAALSGASAESIQGIALGTDDEALRVAAIRMLPDGDAVRRLAGVSVPAEDAAIPIPAAVQRAAQARLAELIDAGSIDFSAFCAQVGSRPAMFSVAALCKDSERLAQLFAAIDDPQLVAQLVVEGPSSRLRQMAATTVEDPAQLKQLLNQVRNKDKSVYKILKQKSDALDAVERKAAEIATEITALCVSLERQSARTYDASYTVAFEHFHARWRALTTQPDAELERRAMLAIDRGREVIAAHQRQAAERASMLAAREAARDAHERAQQSAKESALAQAGAEEQLRLQAAADREAAELARAAKRAAEDQALRQIGVLIGRCNSALGDGNTQQAAGLRRAIHEKLQAAPALPAHLVRQLQQLDDKLHELKQWKDFAVAPKRSELIEEMEGLIGSTEEPQVLAGRIKALQQEWRTISKGIVGDLPADWERFQRASQAAYRPCGKYFAAQAKLREENLQHRRTLLERLSAFESTQDEDTPDWRLVMNVLREAPREWRRYFPVEREAGRVLQKDFDASMERLQSKIDAWYARNLAAKQALITRARHLLTQEDSGEAIEAVKRLQILWKETGPARRDQEQSSWSEFRELCDAVYQKRQQAFTDYTATLEANKVKAVALCEEAERVGALSGAALLEAGAKMPEWQAAFEALDEMPKAEARGLRSRFERALRSCEALMAQQHARDAEQSFTNLFAAGRHVQTYGWAVLQTAEAALRDALKQAAETFIAGVPHWPKGGLQAIKDAFAKADSPSGDDLAVCERTLRLLCIRCEILSDTPTPIEDEVLRREYQVQRLMQGMGQGTSADDRDWDAMALEWIRIGAVAPAVYASLLDRFLRCRAKRPLQVPEHPVFRMNDRADDRGDPDKRSAPSRRGRDPRIAGAR